MTSFYFNRNLKLERSDNYGWQVLTRSEDAKYKI